MILIQEYFITIISIVLYLATGVWYLNWIKNKLQNFKVFCQHICVFFILVYAPIIPFILHEDQKQN